MRTLSNTELDILLAFFESEPGYVLDFSDWTFNDFTEREIGIRVKDLYQEERLSKHKSLCKFCRTPGNEEKAYKLLSSLMNYFDLKLRDSIQFNERGEKAYIKSKEILRAFSAIDSGSSHFSLDEMTCKLRALYREGAVFLVGSSEDKITIGLSHLAAFIEAAIKCREWRIFGHPLVIRVLTDLVKLGGDSIRPAETKLAESAWHDFSGKLNALLLLITKIPELKSEAELVKSWLNLRHSITEKAGGYTFYRSISTSVLSELVERFQRIAVKCHPQYKDTLELMYCGIFNNEWDAFDFLPFDGKSIDIPQIELVVDATGSTKTSEPPITNKDLKDAIEKVGREVCTLKSVEKQRFHITRLQTERIIKELHLENMEVGESTDNTPTELGDIDKQMLEEAYDLYLSGTNRKSAAESVFAKYGRESKYSSLESFRTTFYRFVKKTEKTPQLDD